MVVRLNWSLIKYHPSQPDTVISHNGKAAYHCLSLSPSNTNILYAAWQFKRELRLAFCDFFSSRPTSFFTLAPIDLQVQVGEPGKRINSHAQWQWPDVSSRSHYVQINHNVKTHAARISLHSFTALAAAVNYARSSWMNGEGWKTHSRGTLAIWRLWCGVELIMARPGVDD